MSWDFLEEQTREELSHREHERASSLLQARCKEAFGFYHTELLQDKTKFLILVTFIIQQQTIDLNKLLAIQNSFLNHPYIQLHRPHMLDTTWKGINVSIFSVLCPGFHLSVTQLCCFATARPATKDRITHRPALSQLNWTYLCNTKWAKPCKKVPRPLKSI